VTVVDDLATQGARHLGIEQYCHRVTGPVTHAVGDKLREQQSHIFDGLTVEGGWQTVHRPTRHPGRAVVAWELKAKQHQIGTLAIPIRG
jgi:hypothetical protein